MEKAPAMTRPAPLSEAGVSSASPLSPVLLVEVELDCGIVDELFLLVPLMGMVFMGWLRALVPVDADGSRLPTLDASPAPSSPVPAT